MSSDVLTPTEPVPLPATESESRRIPPVTRVLLGSTVAVFLVQWLAHCRWGGDPVGTCLAFGGQAWAEHRYWTLLTYAWVHAVELPGLPGFFWIHIVANMVLVFSLGPALEDHLGPWRFLALYLGGAIAAALVFHPLPEESIIGASGAAFALIAAAGTAAPRARVTVFFLFLIPIPMNLATLSLSACAVEAASIIFGWMPEVGHSAHLGGAALGFLFVLFLRLTSQLPKIAD